MRATSRRALLSVSDAAVDAMADAVSTSAVTTSTLLGEIRVQALAAVQQGTPFNSTAAMSKIAMVTVVAEESLMTSVTDLATKVTAGATAAEVAADIDAIINNFSGESLDQAVAEAESKVGLVKFIA